MSESLSIHINSPSCDINLDFHCPISKAEKARDENYIIVELIRWIIDDIDELKDSKILSDALKIVDYSSFNSVKNLSDTYNLVINELKHKWQTNSLKPSSFGERAKVPLLKFIIAQCYNRAVREPEKLNQYPPFSAQVYGETSFELVLNILDAVKLLPHETFIDLGSGVGQVVLQIAALADIKLCYGIEKAEYPATCASRLEKEFRIWMDFFAKRYSPFTIVKGDFLTSSIHEYIISADVIFANNFAFGPEVDHQLKLKFQNLKEGTRIISSKAFCPLNFRISDRNLGDIGSIMHVTTLSAISNAVSWTDKPFSYFIHTIDRKILEDYFYRSKNPKLRGEAEGTVNNNNNNNGSKRERSRRGNSNPVGDVRSLRKSLLLRKKSHKIQRKRTASAKPALLKENNVLTEEDIPLDVGNYQKPPRKSSSCHSVISTPTNSCSSSDFVNNENDEHENPINTNNIASVNQASSERSRQSKPLSGQLKEKAMIDKAFKKSTKSETKKAEKRKSVSSHPEDLLQLHQHTSNSIDKWVSSNEATPNDTPYNEPRLVSPVNKYPRVDLNSLSEAKNHASNNKNDILNGYNNQCTPIALQQYLELCKNMFMLHFKNSQSFEYAENLRQQILQERDRNNKIKQKLENFEKTITSLNEEGADLLRKCASKLGIKISPPVTFFTEARKIIKTRTNLEQRIENMISEINELNMANSQLKNEALNKHKVSLNPYPPISASVMHHPSVDSDNSFIQPIRPGVSQAKLDLVNNSIEFSCPPELSPLTKNSKYPTSQKSQQNTPKSDCQILNDSQIPPPPELSAMMNASPTKHSSPEKVGCKKKSMHSSLQDIITEEISPEVIEISNTSIQSDLPELAKEALNPASPLTKSSQDTADSTPPPPSLEHCLPPRKRHWESQLKQSATAGF